MRLIALRNLRPTCLALLGCPGRVSHGQGGG